MMLLYKILFHFNAFIGLRLMKMVYKLWGIKLEFGTKVTYRKGFSLIIGNKGEVKIGDKVFFNNYCSLNALESITIGKGTIFGENVKVYDHNHNIISNGHSFQYNCITTNPTMFSYMYWC